MALSLEITPDNQFIFHGRSREITKEKNRLLAPYGKIIHDYGYILELLPDKQETQKLNQQIGNARFMQNRYLMDRINYYTENKKTLSVSAYKKNIFPQLKEEFPFLGLSDKFTLEAAVENVDQAFKKFFKGEAKFPKFASRNKPKGNKFTSKSTNDNIRLFTGEDGLPYLKLPKIGAVRFVLPKDETIKSIVPDGTRILSISVKHKGDHYTVSLQLETVIDKIEPFKKINASEIRSMDLGIKSFGVYGNPDTEEVIGNPRWVRLHAKRLRRFQKAMSRKQYDQKAHRGSKNWEKARLKVAKEQKKCADQRRDFHHKLAKRIASECRVFVCEDLNIKGMMKNRCLSKAVASVGWGQFLQILKYKLEDVGGRMVKVSRWFPSSQICGACGYKNPEIKKLVIREWTCPKCGAYHDRDGNAMTNIFYEGVRLLKEDYNIEVVPAE